MVKWRMIYYIWGIVVLSVTTLLCALTTAAPYKHIAAQDTEIEYIEDSIDTHLVRKCIFEKLIYNIIYI